MAPQKINIKERLTEDEIDLSMSDLQDVPVKEIAVFKKAVSLDLSNNHLKTLPGNFATLTHLTKLDLSKNELTELPENFGDLVKLKYIDLYQNKLQYLPLSFAKLKALKWLDLKDNPLVPAVAKVSGPCLDAKQCQNCARDVVTFFTQVQDQVTSDLENRQKKRQKQLELKQQKQMETKKIKNKEKTKWKKENGPIKENTTKPSNKKVKKLVSVEQSRQPSSFFKSLVEVFVFMFVVIFILTSVKFEYTRHIEQSCVALYDQGVNLLPKDWQLYVIKAGSYIKYVHDRTGHITLKGVNYVKTTNDFANVYNALCKQVQYFLQKIKEYYTNIIS